MNCPICGTALASPTAKCGGTKPPPFGLRRLAMACRSTAFSRNEFVQRRALIAAAVAAHPELAQRGEIVI